MSLTLKDIWCIFLENMNLKYKNEEPSNQFKQLSIMFSIYGSNLDKIINNNSDNKLSDLMNNTLETKHGSNACYIDIMKHISICKEFKESEYLVNRQEDASSILERYDEFINIVKESSKKHLHYELNICHINDNFKKIIILITLAFLSMDYNGSDESIVGYKKEVANKLLKFISESDNKFDDVREIIEEINLHTSTYEDSICLFEKLFNNHLNELIFFEDEIKAAFNTIKCKIPYGNIEIAKRFQDTANGIYKKLNSTNNTTLEEITQFLSDSSLLIEIKYIENVLSSLEEDIEAEKKKGDNKTSRNKILRRTDDFKMYTEYLEILSELYTKKTYEEKEVKAKTLGRD